MERLGAALRTEVASCHRSASVSLRRASARFASRFARPSSQFAEEGLLDQLLVTVVPVVLGSGLPTFARRLEGEQLRLEGVRAFENGMTELRYDFVR